MNDVALLFSGCQNVAVIAGHYCISPDLVELSSDGEAEVLSFLEGVKHYQSLRDVGVNAHLCLWVNDIGIDPAKRAELKENYTLPVNYAEILITAGVPPTNVEVIFETNSRNKASTWLRKIVKNKPELFKYLASSEENLIRCIDGVACDITTDKMAYVIDGPEGESLVVKEGPNPKCNLILATNFEMIRRKFDCDGIINVFNDIYINRIRLGLHVYRTVFDENHSTLFANIFCTETHTRQGLLDVAKAECSEAVAG